MMLNPFAQHVRRSLRWMAVWLSVWMVASGGWSQETTKPAAGEKPSETPSPKPATHATPPGPVNGPAARGVKVGMDDVFELLDKDGQIRFLPHWRTLEKFEQWLKSLEAGNGAVAPAVSVSSVSFEGTAEANDDAITLEATLTISVNRDDEDVLVPLGLHEATLLKKVEHVGPGEPEFHKFDPEAGYRCWLRGKGPHELKMTLAVLLRRQGASRRLMLRLPETPNSSIKLIVPLPKVSAKGMERGFVKTKSLENSRTEIQAFGPPGSLLDLSWQPVTEVSEVKPELQVVTFIAADLRAESFVLEATQQIRSIQGTFDKVAVRLPPEFELLDVTGRDVKESAAIAGSPGRILVTLTGPTSGPVELKWVLSAKVPANAARLPAIESFEVEDARQQRGHVAVIAWEGVNLRKRDGEDRFVDQDTLAALQREVPGFEPPPRGHGNTTVYRFLKQPFRLILDVQKIEPYFSAEQLQLVRLGTGRADLETSLQVRVFRGSLLELILPWPGFKAEGWETISNDTPEIVEQVAVEETPNGPQLRVRLVDRKTRGSGEFDIRLTTWRAIPTDGSAFDFSLPHVAASGQKASHVIIAPNSNLEVEWTPQSETLARPTTPNADVLETLNSTRNVTAWRWETGSPAFAAKAKVQQQSVRAESVSDLTLDARNVLVKQRIGYEVAFEPLAQVRLMVPRTLTDRVRFQLRDASGQSKPLPAPVFTALEIDQARQCRLPLDPPQVGKFEVYAEFELERLSDGADESVLVNIPVLQSSDAEFSATRVQWTTGEKWTASLDDAAWKPELGTDKTSTWKANGTKSVIAVRVASTSDLASQDFTVHRALIRTVVGEGRAHSQALLELDRDVREITLALPPEIAAKNFQVWWNGVPVAVETITRGVDSDTEVRLRQPPVRRPPAGESADLGDKPKTSLWWDYVSQQPTHFGWSNRHQLVSPKFAKTVWIAQTIWQVVLPSDQHLLTTPRDFATQFHWQRSVLLWTRQPNAGYDRIDRVLQEAAADQHESVAFMPVAAGETSSVYPFSCFGPPQPLVFWTMSRSAVVGCGAGLALLLGFVLIRMPATRHVLTFLVVGFLMALIALWFAEPVKVLLQPAILGAAMAVAAAIIDRVGRREPQTPMVTLSSPSDFYASSGSGVRIAAGGVVAEASTAPPQPAVPSEPVSASSAGGRS